MWRLLQDATNEVSMAQSVANTFFLLFICLAIFVVVVFMTYLICYIADKYFNGAIGATFNALHNNNQRFIAGGVVARDAGLTCMTKEERRQVLGHVLTSQPYNEEILLLMSLGKEKSREKSTGVQVQDTEQKGRVSVCDEEIGADASVLPGKEVPATKLLVKGSNSNGDENENEEAQHPESLMNMNHTPAEPVLLHVPTEPSTTHADEEYNNTDESGDEERLTRMDHEHSKGCAICLNAYGKYVVYYNYTNVCPSFAHNFQCFPSVSIFSVCLMLHVTVKGEQVVLGRHCSHMFHTGCLLDWLDNHDVCPFCRLDVLSADEMREGAFKVFGEAQFCEILGRDPLYPANNHGAEEQSGNTISAADNVNATAAESTPPAPVVDESARTNPALASASQEEIGMTVSEELGSGQQLEFVATPTSALTDLEEQARMHSLEVPAVTAPDPEDLARMQPLEVPAGFS
jgi:hypothetical protein